MYEIALGKALDALIDHRGKTPRKLGGEFTSNGVRVISAVNVREGKLDLTSTDRCVTHELYERWMSTPLHKGDVILTSEAPLGEVALVPTDEPLVLGQRLYGLRGRAGVLDSKYLYYTLRYPPVCDQLHARATGTTVTGIRQSELIKVCIPDPGFKQQAAIAEVLGALDDKIALNEKVCRVSLSLARTLYEQALETMDVTTKPLREVADLRYGKALPLRARLPGHVPVFGSNGITGSHNRHLVPGPGIVIGRKGTVGIVHWSERNFFPIDTTFFVRLSADDIPMEFMFFALQDLGLDTMDSDSAVPGLNRGAALAREILLPPVTRLHEFGAMADPLFRVIEAKRKESETLAELRDTLLPKLMSGEIRVKDAERRVEEAV